MNINLHCSHHTQPCPFVFNSQQVGHVLPVYEPAATMLKPSNELERMVQMTQINRAACLLESCRAVSSPALKHDRLAHNIERCVLKGMPVFRLPPHTTKISSSSVFFFFFKPFYIFFLLCLGPPLQRCEVSRCVCVRACEIKPPPLLAP